MYLRWYIQLPAQFAHAPSALHVHLVLLEGPPCMYYSTFNCQLDSLMHPQYALHVHLVLLEAPPSMYNGTFNCQLDSLMHPQYALHVHLAIVLLEAPLLVIQLVVGKIGKSLK